MRLDLTEKDEKKRGRMQQEATLTIIANGKAYMRPPGDTISDLLAAFQINVRRVVVQMDGVIIPREEFGATCLRDGARLEIVTLVGGG